MNLRLFTMICAFGLIWAGCINSVSTPGRSVSVAETGTDSESSDLSLPLPEIPAIITTPQERAAYAAEHFWDALDFSSDGRAIDTAFIEQNFANYIVILGATPPASAQQSVEELLEAAGQKPDALDLMLTTADKYLDDPNSPMRSEDLYLLFLNAVADNTLYNVAHRTRASERRTLAMLNRPGTHAADIRLTLRTGRASTLYRAIEADTTLVLFYDSGCTNCKTLITRLTQPGVQLPYHVLAIDVAGDRDLWDSGKATLPSNWQVAFATGDVEDAELYYFPALPSLYLLAPDATVILKDFSPIL